LGFLPLCPNWVAQDVYGSSWNSTSLSPPPNGAHNFPFDPLRDIEGLTRKLPVDLIHLVALRCTVFVSSGFDLFSCLGFSGGCVEVIRWNVERSYHN